MGEKVWAIVYFFPPAQLNNVAPQIVYFGAYVLVLARMRPSASSGRVSGEWVMWQAAPGQQGRCNSLGWLSILGSLDIIRHLIFRVPKKGPSF